MKPFRYILAVVLLSILSLFGCGYIESPGIYYPALSHQFLMQNLAPSTFNSGCRSISASKLYYNEEVYTYAQGYREYNKNDLPLDTLPDLELCTVYGNDGFYWSDSEENLAACTHTGTLYRVAGYEEAFRVCLYFEEPARVDMGHGPIYHLYVFDRTNNMTLYNGKDYFSDLYHFPDHVTLNTLDQENKDVSAFLDALLQAELIDPADENLPVFDYAKEDAEAYYVTFTDALGIQGFFEVYEDGYVVNKKDHNFILKLEPSLCQSIIDQLHEPDWPGEYIYVTYAYDKARNTRTELKYELIISETDTHWNIDLCVTQTEVSLNTSDTPIDNPVIVGPRESLAISKEEAGEKHVLSFVSQRFPDSRPDLITYTELKKSKKDTVIYLRYASSEEDLAEEEYVALNKQ